MREHIEGETAELVDRRIEFLAPAATGTADGSGEARMRRVMAVVQTTADQVFAALERARQSAVAALVPATIGRPVARAELAGFGRQVGRGLS